jgi:hypothetical protein
VLKYTKSRTQKVVKNKYGGLFEADLKLLICGNLLRNKTAHTGDKL